MVDRARNADARPLHRAHFDLATMLAAIAVNPPTIKLAARDGERVLQGRCEYFTVMAKIALNHGATIDRFIGDAMLMLFGDPEMKGVAEDAAACVAMALAMQCRMRELQAEWRGPGMIKPLRMCIGVVDKLQKAKAAKASSV